MEEDGAAFETKRGISRFPNHPVGPYVVAAVTELLEEHGFDHEHPIVSTVLNNAAMLGHSPALRAVLVSIVERPEASEPARIQAARALVASSPVDSEIARLLAAFVAIVEQGDDAHDELAVEFAPMLVKLRPGLTLRLLEIARSHRVGATAGRMRSQLLSVVTKLGYVVLPTRSGHRPAPRCRH